MKELTSRDTAFSGGERVPLLHVRGWLLKMAVQRVLYLGRVQGVASEREFSTQTLALLAALCSEASAWRHGYDLAKQTGLKSGTLYPILIRLSDRGLVEACWEDIQPAGRPRRHLYRLTRDGLARAEAALARADAAAAGSAARGSAALRRSAAPGRRRLAGEGQ